MKRSWLRNSTIARSAASALAFILADPSPIPAAPSPSLAPLLHASEGWVGAQPAASDLAGKVVVVDVFTFGCINCKNVTPNLRALYRRHEPGLAIVGIHTPETPYERERGNVVANLKTLGIAWPVAIDNSQALWNAYGVDAWPTQLIFDRHGKLRKTIVGDSQDEAVDREIDALLAER
jgi:thiol-disulfide isomerase/thioredoxin